MSYNNKRKNNEYNSNWGEELRRQIQNYKYKKNYDKLDNTNKKEVLDYIEKVGYKGTVNKQSKTKHNESFQAGRATGGKNIINLGNKRLVNLHEFGHFIASKDRKSSNSKLADKVREFQKRAIENEKRGKSNDSLYLDILKWKNDNILRTEHEANIHARKLKGGKGNMTKEEKKFLESQIKHYYYLQGVDGKTLDRAMAKDQKKYDRQIKMRGGIKIAGTVGGAYAGNKLAKLSTKKMRKEIVDLKKNDKKTEKERKRLKRLNLKSKAINFVGTMAGGYAGYKGGKFAAKKYAISKGHNY